MIRILGSCLLLLFAVQAWAGSVVTATEPVVREIAFEGNKTTRAQTMLRELVIHVGDPADPQKIERSRQAILDLNLFNAVSVREEPVSGGVRLVYSVVEKIYILPYPRLSANAYGQYGYGAALDWSNVAGLNHSLSLVANQSEPNRTGYGKQTSYSGSYYAPFLFDSPYNLSLSGGYSRQPQTDTRGDAANGQPFVETFDTWEVDGSRTWSDGPASRGWTVGSGWLSQHENRSGPGALPPYGAANAVVGFAVFHDIREKVYSEEGTQFSFRTEAAVRGLASNYGYTLFNTSYDRYLPVGTLEYENLQLHGELGLYYAGPDSFSRFSLGGASGLYAFPSYQFVGNGYYRLAALYQRPFFRPWLRALVGLEGGNVSTLADSTLFDAMHLSLDLGLRVRVTWFVNFQFQAGWAIPLNGSSRGRGFGGRY